MIKKECELKATLKGTRQENKRLKKQLKLNFSEYEKFQEVKQSIVNDYHALVDDLQKELVETKMALKEANRKKWYQFRKI